MTPEIQYFGQGGTWVKPPRAVAVDVTVCAADTDGVLGDGSCKYVLGNESEPNVRRFPAGELPDSLTVSVHLGGRDGYALIVTHFADDRDVAVSEFFDAMAERDPQELDRLRTEAWEGGQR
ncbi:MAG TPA: hypothetical protein VGH54_11940 [Mycobacterium sp.]|jgi:hypothetical protein|uniref:hypothetical protein n=1 Tax=Mycobacterium sp. TaxID=1785 RepID=UPI002F3FC7C2